MKLFKTLALAVAVLTFVPALGNAATTSSTGIGMGYVGALLGPSFLSNGGGTAFVFGAHGDYLVMPNITAGAYLTYESVGGGTTTLPGFGTFTTSSTSLLTLAAEGNYFFLPGQLAYAGAKLGLGFASGNGNSTTSLVIGPHIGYMYPVAANITLGGEANYLIYTASGSSNAFNILGQINYMF